MFGVGVIAKPVQVLRDGKHIELADQLISQVLPVALKLELDLYKSAGSITAIFQPFSLKPVLNYFVMSCD